MGIAHSAGTRYAPLRGCVSPLGCVNFAVGAPPFGLFRLRRVAIPAIRFNNSSPALIYISYNHSARVRTRFSWQSFRFCVVKILVNPKGLTAVCAVQNQKSCTRKFCDPKGADCSAILNAEREARLTPCEGDKLKSARKTRVLGVFGHVRYG